MAINLTPTEFGAYHISNSNSKYRYEPQRTNNFTLIVHLDDIRKVDYTSYDETQQTIKNASDVVYYSVLSSSMPHFNQQPIAISRGNNKVKFAGVPQFNDGQFEVYDYIGEDSKAVLMAWQGLSYDVNTEAVGRASEYKKDCSIIERTPDNKWVCEWVMHGCWVSGIEEDNSSYAQNDVKKMRAKIQYDWAEVKYIDSEINV